MADLNKKICVEGGANTGFGDCVLIPTNIIGAFLFRQRTEFTPEQLQDFVGTLQGLANDPDPKARVYPIHSFEAITDNTEDPTEETLGYGGVVTLRENPYNWLLRFIQGGVCLLKALRKFNGPGNHILFYDAQGVVYGQKVGDNLVTIPLDEFWAQAWRPNDGTASSLFNVKFLFQPYFINEDIGYVDIESIAELRSVQGLLDVSIRPTADFDAATGNLDVKLVTSCGGDDLFELFEDEFNDPSMWILMNEDLGTTAVITVAVNADNMSWTITPTGPGFPGSVNYSLQIAPVDVLEANGVEGYEGIKYRFAVTVT